MRQHFRNISRAKVSLAARRFVLGALVGVILGGVLPTPVRGLVGPAREAPEYAPYAVMVLDKSDGSYCTASVITPEVVLTAAHCVSKSSQTQVFFRGGDGDGKSALLIAGWLVWILASVLFAWLTIRSGRIRPRIGIEAGLVFVLLVSVLALYLRPRAALQLVFFDIAATAIHPDYRQGGVSIDLALLRLTRPLPASFEPVEIRRASPVETGERLRIAGFGWADDEEVGGTPGVLRTAELTVSELKSQVFIRLIDPDGTGLGGCTGDSGAPLFAGNEPRQVAVAIMANGEGGRQCGASTIAVQLAPQLPWIREKLQAWGASQRPAQ